MWLKVTKSVPLDKLTWYETNNVFISLAGAAAPILIAGIATSSVGAATNIGIYHRLYKYDRLFL